MARVTVEDCIERIPNRFELVMAAAQRVRDINAGSQITVDRDRDKNPVVALREIADSTIDLNELKEGLVKRNQRISMAAEETEEQIDVIEGDEAAWASMAQEALESGNDMNFDDAEEEEMEEAAEFSAASAEAADDDAF